MKKRGVVLSVCLLIAAVSVVGIIYLYARSRNQEDGDLCVIRSSTFTSKYDFANYFALMTSELPEAKFMLPENVGLVEGYALHPEVDISFRTTRYNISIEVDTGISERVVKHYEKKYVFKEVNGIKYFYLNEYTVYFRNNGYIYTIDELNASDKEFDLDSFVNNVKFVEYEFVGEGIARGKVYDESKTLEYTLNGTGLDLSYMYREIDYINSIEYDVYTDGVNEFMFDHSNNLIGYKIKEVNKSIILRVEDIDVSDFRLEKEIENTYFVKRQYKDDLITNGFLRYKVDDEGNVTEFLKNSLDKEVKKVDEKKLEKELKEKLEELYFMACPLEFEELESYYYSLDAKDNPVVVCFVKVKVEKPKGWEIVPNQDEVILQITIGVDEVGGN